jgi:enoyl-CoA hydratase
LCERVVPRGQARQAAEALALEIARFPQGAVRADRRSAYAQHSLPLRAAMEQEWAGGAGTLSEAIQGAGRFASGKGRHGAFEDI